MTGLTCFTILSLVAYCACADLPDCGPGAPLHQPHPTDCSKYYTCDNGEAVEQSCAPGLWWSVDIEGCDFPANVECSAGGSSPPPDSTTPGGSTPPVETTTGGGSTPPIETTTGGGSTPPVETTAGGASTPPVETTTGGGSTPPVETTTGGASTPPVETTTGGGSTPPVETTTDGGSTPPVETTTGGGSTPPVETTTGGGSTPPVETTTGGASTPPVETTTGGGSTPPVETTTVGGSTPPVETTTGGSSTPPTESTSATSSIPTEAPTNSHPDRCPPAGTGGEVIRIPHETKCNFYYRCDDGTPVLFSCPGDDHFSPTKRVCRPSNVAGCSVCPAVDEVDDVVRLLHPTHCFAYYLCKDGKMTTLLCPSNWHFSRVMRQCMEPVDAKCTGIP